MGLHSQVAWLYTPGKWPHMHWYVQAPDLHQPSSAAAVNRPWARFWGFRGWVNGIAKWEDTKVSGASIGVQSFPMTLQICIQTSLHMAATSPFISINVFTFMSFNLIPAYYVIMVALCKRAGHLYFCPVIMVALCNRADHYIFALWFLSSIFFFFSSPSLSGRRLDVYHTLTHGVALVRI